MFDDTPLCMFNRLWTSIWGWCNTHYIRYVDSHDGVQVAVPEHPKRILSLSSAFDTILLGFIEPERLVGINKLSTYEEYSLEAKRAKLVKPVLSKKKYPWRKS